jgi:hypothetical protein
MDLPEARIDVAQWEFVRTEQQGSHESAWIIEPETKERWLRKFTVVPANGIEQGEDWAEVTSTAVARQLGVPCAETRLCVDKGRRGSISKNVRPQGFDLWEGTLILQRSPDVLGYFPHAEGTPALDPARLEVRRPGHNLYNIKIALRDVEPPMGFEGPGACDAFDVFAGYLVLDALIANRDRHEQNWGVLTPQLASPPERLCPSYDHAGSLGYNLLDARRIEMLNDPARLGAWAEKGTAYRFEHVGQPATLAEHAAKALGMCSRDGFDWWADRLRSLSLRVIAEGLRGGAVDGMSHPASMFAAEILELNHRRMIDAIHPDN